jgi:hypothetical protein
VAVAYAVKPAMSVTIMTVFRYSLCFGPAGSSSRSRVAVTGKKRAVMDRVTSVLCSDISMARCATSMRTKALRVCRSKTLSSAHGKTTKTQYMISMWECVL